MAIHGLQQSNTGPDGCNMFFIPVAVPTVPRVITKVLELFTGGEMCPRTLLQLVQKT